MLTQSHLNFGLLTDCQRDVRVCMRMGVRVGVRACERSHGCTCV